MRVHILTQLREPALNLSAKYYREHCPFATATHDDNYAGDKHFVFDKNGDLVSSYPTREIAEAIAVRMNEQAAEALMVEGTRADHG